MFDYKWFMIPPVHLWNTLSKVLLFQSIFSPHCLIKAPEGLSLHTVGGEKIEAQGVEGG